MAGFTAHGATVTYAYSGGGVVNAVVTSLTVQAPEAELTDITASTALLGANVIAPTGDTSPGTVSLDFVATSFLSNPQELIGTYGNLTLSSPNYGVSRQVVCQSASITASTGDAVRGSISFTITDYYG